LIFLFSSCSIVLGILKKEKKKKSEFFVSFVLTFFFSH